jgi:hypothetical protein
VSRQTLNQPSQLIGPGIVKRTQRHHNQIHHQKDRDSVEETANQPMIWQKIELAAGKAIDCCG